MVKMNVLNHVMKQMIITFIPLLPVFWCLDRSISLQENSQSIFLISGKNWILRSVGLTECNRNPVIDQEMFLIFSARYCVTIYFSGLLLFGFENMDWIRWNKVGVPNCSKLIGAAKSNTLTSFSNLNFAMLTRSLRFGETSYIVVSSSSLK